MRIEDVLRRLEGVSRGANGQHMARCPAHEDKRASLAIRQGDKGIVLHCMAGCATEEICARLGIKVADLFDEARQAVPSPKAAPKAEPQKTRMRAEAFRVGAVYNAKGQGGERRPEKIVKVYEYEDLNGLPLMQVARTDHKSFPTIYRADGAWWWGDGGHGDLLYRLPQVKKAIENKEQIWIVEGEKDVESLESLGFTATTNKGGAGKWPAKLSEELRGARVVIVPDLDDAGRNHGRIIARQLEHECGEVKLLNLRKIDPSLPDKGDVSDLIARLGEGARESLTAAAREKALSLSRRVDDTGYSDYYEGIRGFAVQNGAICQWKNDAWAPLCNFTALPTEEIIRDNGNNELSTMIKLIGWDGSGRRLPAVTVTAEQFGTMNWPLKNWGLTATIRSGNGLKERLREAIQTAGDRCAIRKYCYTHTGWRKIDGSLVYLHGGGAIGGEDAIVDLDYNFNRYDLSGVVSGPALTLDRDARLEYCAVKTLQCTTIAGLRVGAPLVGYMFLTPLRYFLEKIGRRPSFIPFVRGRTGSGKSLMASLILNHFGRDFSYDAPHPASFDDTANAISLKLFTLKDMPLLIDDYHPEENPLRRRAMEDVAQRVSRMIGDGARRSRMRNDATGQEDKPARALCVQTGEDLPRVTESGVARMYVIDLKKGDVPIGDEALTDLQTAAREGCLSETMRQYIEWLKNEADGLPEALEKNYREFLAEALRRLKGAHARIPPLIAYLMLGLRAMLDFLRARGILPEDCLDKMMEGYWEAIMINIEGQVREMSQDAPIKIFIATLRELIDSDKVRVELISARGKSEHNNVIGCCDESYYYFNPGQTFGAVQRALSEQGTSFPLGKNMLLKTLADEGLIVRDPGTRNNVRQLNKGGVRAWLMWMPRGVIDRTEQMRIDEMEVVDDGHLSE